ncbi:uncharacterized protein LOC107274923 isoform X1 [Cephus cinctus]|uniref:Uncharacterized protein LOC107274923 isoform X1 n=1 Tax=Cephus cinctus TaxID=211228 RepID=A0AAJ7CGH2_CEPCN|nr:uncharacterized protein LOC107274923 isoform X1 [Cephus cinctus]
MYVEEEEDFAPKNFLIFNHYGKDTLFFWDNEKLVVCPYGEADTKHTLKTPDSIKTLKCFGQRVFVICQPTGIYKLSKDMKLLVLSENGIELADEFYNVFYPRSGIMYLFDKKEKRERDLLPLSTSVPSSTVHSFALNSYDTKHDLREAIFGDSEFEPTDNLCVFVYDKRIFKLCKNSINLIYCSQQTVTDIVPWKSMEKTCGLIFLAQTEYVIFMYTKNQEIVFEKANLGTNIHSLCAFPHDGSLNIIYCDEMETYITKKIFGSEQLEHDIFVNQYFLCFQVFKEKLLALTPAKVLLERSLILDFTEDMDQEQEEFVELNCNMLSNTEEIVDKICEDSKILQKLDLELQAEEDKNQRLNLYAHQKKFQYQPKMNVKHIAGKVFLSADFANIFPKNSWVYLNLINDGKKVTCGKLIKEFETVLEMLIPEEFISDSLDITVDLVTHTNEGQPWCLIKNCLKDSPPKKKKEGLKLNKISFIESKLATLRKLQSEDCLDIEKLSEIKKSVRKEINNS